MSRPTPVPATQASGQRHDVPAAIRQQAVELKALADRYVAAMGRQWVADEAVAPSAGLLLAIARTSLNLHAEHAAFLAATSKEDQP